ncbi:MAG TPA: DHA2 family efflux MFS transporter permease subunit [Ktedonobacteraceae bacterium]|nr:DHA2 family efflux MFS transporter permease subunit [Ktedonobacteraceae bacterium]
MESLQGIVGSDMSPSTNNGDSNYKWKVLASVIFGTFMVILDSTAVNVAIPTFQRVFGASVDQIDGILTTYVLALGIVTPMAGWFSERFGIKRVYLTSLGLFVAGSILCAFSPSLPLLVVFRALQGLGGGMLGPLGIALLFGAFPERERGAAFGIYGIPLIVAPASGPVLGGYFVQYLDWRYIFFINIPVGIAGIILGALWLRENRRGTSARLDIPGILLSTVSFGTLLYAIQRGSGDGWTSPRILALLSIGFVAFLAFVIVELRVKDPLLDLRLFARRTYLFANMLGWVSVIALFGAEFLLPIYLQTLRGRTPLEAGLLVLPLAISSGIVVPIAGFLYNRIGPRWLLAFGSLLLAVNTFEFAHIGVDTSYLEIMIIVAIRGVALGCVLQTTLTAALTGLRPAQLPRASSLLNATRNVFQSFGIALLGTIITTQFAIYQKASVSDIHHPATSLGQQFIHSVQALMQQGLPSFAAQKAAMGQLIGTIFNPHGPIFQLNFIAAINDAYWLTFWLSVATLALAFTLPGRSKIETGTSGREEAPSPAPIGEQI